VNDELGQLDRVLAVIPERLNAGGRFVAVSYHSLEDRRVKQMLRREAGLDRPRGRHVPQDHGGPAPRLRILTRRAVVATAAETRRNPRARSAKLRAGERLS
jgi:16S rRNA (cytosine1402-N4)-methyltransferase